jgi:hypothetical protein
VLNVGALLVDALNLLAELSTVDEAVAHGVATARLMQECFDNPDTDRVLAFATSILEGLGCGSA